VNPGRNSPCPCGSGKKYKECCGRIAHTASVATQPQPEHAIPAEDMAQLATLMNAGRVMELEVAAKRLTDTYPHVGVIWQLLAVALSAQHKDSLAALQTAANLLPDDAVAQLNLGNALARLQRKDEAMTCFRKAVQLNPDLVQAHHSLGNALYESGQFASAIPCYQRVLALQPTFAEAHGSLGSALSALGRLNEAIASYQQALRLAPELVEVHVNLGNALRELAQLDDAIACYETALQLRPDLLQCHTSIATALRLQANTDAAELRCQHALTLHPDDNSALIVLAEIRADQGRFVEAEQLFKQVIDNDPHITEAWSSLTRIRKLTLADGPLMQVAQSVANSSMPARKELYVRYALGKYCDDIKEYDQAFSHYHRANELSKLVRPEHSQLQVTRDVDLMINYFDRAFFAQQSHSGNPSTRPVFIVGMLRSGTSLTEQILASHPAIVGAGELPFWGRAAAAFDFSPRDIHSASSAITVSAEG
jgi:tetratricopeptide (TPR) repeat protein